MYALQASVMEMSLRILGRNYRRVRKKSLHAWT